jgi:hypothetical protein
MQRSVGLQPLPLSATRAQRNCDGGYALRDGSATEGYAFRDGSATEGYAFRDGSATEGTLCAADGHALRDGCATERPTRDTHAPWHPPRRRRQQRHDFGTEEHGEDPRGGAREPAAAMTVAG